MRFHSPRKRGEKQNQKWQIKRHAALHRSRACLGRGGRRRGAQRISILFQGRPRLFGSQNSLGMGQRLLAPANWVFKMNKKIAVLYHKGCTDGFGAAWAAWKKFGARAEYLGVERGH